MVGKFSLGGKVRQRNAIQDVEETEWELADGASDIVLGQDVGTLEFSNDGYNAGRHAFPSIVTERDEIDTFIDRFQSRLDGAKNIEADAEDYDLKERVTAFYAMTEVNFSQNLMVLPGVRYELTQLDVQGFDFDPDAETLTSPGDEHSYGQLFPMVHVRYRFTPRTNLRLAFTRTLARPNFFELVPYRIRDDEDLEIGNPELIPTTAMSYDVMFEHYDRLIGIVSAGVFYKQVVDPIFTFVEPNNLGGDTEQKRNGESAMIVGVETALHRQLLFLPAPFDGLGIFANYTYTDSESTLPGGLEAPLPGQADHVFNAALSYEKRGFSGQVSASYHSDHVDDFGGDTDAPIAREEDEYIGSHLQIDLSASYMAGPNVQIFGELNNLTNQRFTLYQGIQERPIQYEWYERWGRLGVRYRL
jgi:TonB-dependent receptor